MYQVLIMDFDGVIVESNESKTVAFEELFAEYPDISEAMMDFHLKNFSRSRMVKFEHYVFELLGRPGDTEAVVAMARRFSELVNERVVNCPEVPGARRFLEEFSACLPIYLSSATPQAELEKILEARGLRAFFTRVFGDPPHRKSDVVELVLEEQGVGPDAAAFIGDAITDYQVAQGAGIDFIGRDSGLDFQGAPVTLYGDLTELGDALRSKIVVLR